MLHKNLAKKVKRSDQEWMDLIQECRTSGMSDRAWLDLHDIPHSTFYLHIRDLRKKACTIPEVDERCFPVPGSASQEVVPIPESCFCHQEAVTDSPAASDTAIRLRIGSISLEITNNASGSTIKETISVLRELC